MSLHRMCVYVSVKRKDMLSLTRLHNKYPYIDCVYVNVKTQGHVVVNAAI